MYNFIWRDKRLQLLRAGYTLIPSWNHVLIERSIRSKFFSQAVTTCATVVHLVSLLSERPP